MVLIQQIKSIIIVNLQIAHIHTVLMSRILAYFRKNVRQRARNNTAISVSLGASGDCEGLSGASLTVGEYCTIVALQTAIYHVFGNLVENSLLLCKHIENSIELEHEGLLPDFIVLKPIFPQAKLNLVLVAVQLELGQVWFLGRPHPDKHLNSISFLRHFKRPNLLI